MSQENVEIVMGPLPAPEVDFVSLFRDDRTAARSAEAIAHQLDEEFEVAIRGMPDGEKTYAGLDGLRSSGWTGGHLGRRAARRSKRPSTSGIGFS